MRLLFAIICLSFSLLACAQNDKSNFSLIPEPVSVKAEKGQFVFAPQTVVSYAQGQADLALALEYFTGSFNQAADGFKLAAQMVRRNEPARNEVFFTIKSKKFKNPEAYSIKVLTNGIQVEAGGAPGAFYAVQTLRQLLPPAIFATTPQKNVTWAIPCCTIEDAPRFQYRGMHLDVARHWFPVASVKRYIDLLAAHKMNRFHWHLTEDQGWRIEVKKYPKLQQVSSCRVQTLVGHYTDQPVKYDGVPYCHYYTQAEVKEIVEYARKRFVTIVPEIEMPGHSLAALAAYPNLGCEGASYSTATTWGVFDDVYCAGNEDVFKFIEDVLDEVCPLFPGEYVHIGGDECPKTRWKECAKCQKRMKEEGLKDEHELQSYFIKRAEKMLTKHNKKLIGWDEILEGGLSPNATVMSWRGVEGGIAAAKAGHDAIMTPGSHCYFDHYQSDPNTEPVAIGGLTTLEKAYSYEPIPSELNEQEAKHILGVQANLWTEYIKTPDYLEYMAYPRACALAEVAWSPAASRNWDSFRGRISTHFSRLDMLKVNYAKSFYDIGASYNGGQVTLQSSAPDVQIRYTLDGTDPKISSKPYTAPFRLEKNTTVKASAWRKEKCLGKVLTVDYLVHKASGKTYTMTQKPTRYNGGDTYGLTNGVLGGVKTWGNWVGIVNQPIDPVIDLGENTVINRVTTHYFDNKQAWIHPPKSIEVFISSDGKNFESIGKKEIAANDDLRTDIKTVVISSPSRPKARYVKLVAIGTGVIPEGFPGAREGSYMFLDEVIVE